MYSFIKFGKPSFHKGAIEISPATSQNLRTYQ